MVPVRALTPLDNPFLLLMSNMQSELCYLPAGEDKFPGPLESLSPSHQGAMSRVSAKLFGSAFSRTTRVRPPGDKPAKFMDYESMLEVR